MEICQVGAPDILSWYYSEPHHEAGVFGLPYILVQSKKSMQLTGWNEVLSVNTPNEIP
jgi:hypothetical protein